MTKILTPTIIKKLCLYYKDQRGEFTGKLPGSPELDPPDKPTKATTQEEKAIANAYNNLQLSNFSKEAISYYANNFTTHLVKDDENENIMLAKDIEDINKHNIYFSCSYLPEYINDTTIKNKAFIDCEFYHKKLENVTFHNCILFKCSIEGTLLKTKFPNTHIISSYLSFYHIPQLKSPYWHWRLLQQATITNTQLNMHHGPEFSQAGKKPTQIHINNTRTI